MNGVSIRQLPAHLRYYLKKLVAPLFHGATRLSVALNANRFRYVFVLAHMRSGSTLLSHILGSHPDFVYAGETYFRFETPADFRKLAIDTCRRLHRLWLTEPFIVGQINWAGLKGEMLASPLVHNCVILIRRPEATLRSRVITPLAPGISGMSEAEALSYYANRLDELAQYGEVLGAKAILVDYDDLIDDPNEIVAALTKFFDASPSFYPQYKINRTTGGHGDPSPNILIGNVVRTPTHDVTIGAETLSRALSAYKECRRRLRGAGVRFAKEDRHDTR